jgi:Mn-dependent DtxR family transcriptional regulator
MFADKSDLFSLDDNGHRSFITYDSELDDDIIHVLFRIERDEINYRDIAKSLELPENYVQLIMHVTSELGLTEYGTSPRNSWLTDKGEKYLQFLKGEINAEYI